MPALQWLAKVGWCWEPVQWLPRLADQSGRQVKEMETKEKMRTICHYRIKRHTHRHGRAKIRHETDGITHRYWCSGHMGAVSHMCIESAKPLSVRHLFRKYANKDAPTCGVSIRRQTAWESWRHVWAALKVAATIALPILLLWRILIWYLS